MHASQPLGLKNEQDRRQTDRAHLYDLLDVLDLFHELHPWHLDVQALPDRPDRPDLTQQKKRETGKQIQHHPSPLQKGARAKPNGAIATLGVLYLFCAKK